MIMQTPKVVKSSFEKLVFYITINVDSVFRTTVQMFPTVDKRTMTRTSLETSVTMTMTMMASLMTWYCHFIFVVFVLLV